MDLSKSKLIVEKSSISDALLACNNEPYGVCFVVDKKDLVIGLFTDGDLRRMIVGGKGVNHIIKNEDLKKFVHANYGTPISKLKKLISNKITFLPLLDKDGKIIDFFRLENRISKIPISYPNIEQGNELEYLIDAFHSSWISSRGKYIDKFEQEFSKFVDCSYGISTSNGTVALQLALTSLGIGKGDEVIVPNFTFAATINSVLHSGATPVLADVEKDFWTIDPVEIRKLVTEKTKAIIPVHIYGQICDMDAICKISKESNLFIIEDCAEAHGGMFNGRKVGSFGIISTFSFFGNKIITTGEGGMCTTNSKELHLKMCKLRDHGMSKEKKYWHDIIGYNFRMTNLQAAIGCAQLEKIELILKKNKNIEIGYKAKLGNTIIWQSNKDKRRQKVVWLVTGLASFRDELLKQSDFSNIELRRVFYPLNSMPIYKKYGRGDYPVSNIISKKGVSFPTNIKVDIKVASEFIKNFYRSKNETI